MAKFHSFLWLSVPLCVYVCIFIYIYTYIYMYMYIYLTSSLPIHLLMDTWIASISWQLERMLLWTLGCIYLFELVFSFSLDIYTGMELLDHMVFLFLIFWGTSILFSIVAEPVYIPTNSVQGFSFLCILANICYLWCFWW